jgi:hypothetical protein
MESYYSAREMAAVRYMHMSVPMEILGKHLAFMQNYIHNAELNPTNDSINLTRNWTNLAPLFLISMHPSI